MLCLFGCGVFLWFLLTVQFDTSILWRQCRWTIRTMESRIRWRCTAAVRCDGWQHRGQADGYSRRPSSGWEQCRLEYEPRLWDTTLRSAARHGMSTTTTTSRYLGWCLPRPDQAEPRLTFGLVVF